ncbi:MAG: hypothetical protein HOO08_09910 [Opitutae bacterium]|jgi:hypothetical protein|nr:hypothetical protein [Opitutae bacterium]
MGLLKNIAKRTARQAAMSDFERLKVAIQQFPEKSIGDIFQVTANLAPALSAKLPDPHNVTFDAAMTLTRGDFKGNEQIREDLGRLLPILTKLEKDSKDAPANWGAYQWGIYFWRVVLMTMLHDELYDDARKLWELIKQREKTKGRSLCSMCPSYYQLK